MSNNRFYKDIRADVPHRENRDERDLRRDLYEGLSNVADSIGVFIKLEVDEMEGGDSSVKVRGLSQAGLDGDPVPNTVFEFMVFNDAYGVTPATNASLGTVTVGKGTILSTSPATALVVKTNAEGVFEGTLTDAVDEKVYLAADHTVTGPNVQTAGSLEVEFTA